MIPENAPPATEEALRKRLAEWLYSHRTHPHSAASWADLPAHAKHFWLSQAAALLPLFLDHGRQQAAQALRDGRDHHLREAEKCGTAWARWHREVADDYRRRADEIHGRQQ